MSLKKITRSTVFVGLCFLMSLGKLPGWLLPGKAAIRFQQRASGQVQSPNSIYVTAHLHEPIDSANLLWCSTFQLAWNELGDLIGEDIHFENEPPMVDYLNQKDFTKDQIDDASYVAMAGFVGDDIIPQINQAMTDKFPDASPSLIPSGEGLNDQDIIAYAYLFKSLHFVVPFERLDDPLAFQGANVSAFGVSLKDNAEHDVMITQVSILDYQGGDDFIIELQTDSTEDRLILAKVQPAQTLQTTIDQIRSRIDNSEAVAMEPGDLLEIPLIQVDVNRVYEEIMDLTLIAENPVYDQNYWIRDARQDIRFDMDEKGVELESEVVINMACMASSDHIPNHYLVFDKPFLVMMQRVGAAQPYFALWVNNADVLVAMAE